MTSTFILFFSCILVFFFFLLGLGSKTYVASTLMNIHIFFFIVCVSVGAFHVFLYELYDLNCVYELSS